MVKEDDPWKITLIKWLEIPWWSELGWFGNHPYIPIASMYVVFTWIYHTIQPNIYIYIYVGKWDRNITWIWWLIHPHCPQKKHLFARPRRALPLHPHVGPREVFLVKSWFLKIHGKLCKWSCANGKLKIPEILKISLELSHEVVQMIPLGFQPPLKQWVLI